ncbi:MAG: hypothetical protein ACO2ZB_04555 [Gammaproteobacteria bacterium]
MYKFLKLFAVFTSAIVLAACGGGGGSSDSGSGGSGGGSGGGSTFSCPTGTTAISVAGTLNNVCSLSGTLTANTTLTNDAWYFLDGPVFVGEAAAKDGTGGSGITLTIEAGTTVYGAEGTSSQADGALFVSRGNKIEAVGTASAPIIFTSAQDLGVAAHHGGTQRDAYDGIFSADPNTSEWGGLAINGLATINTCNETEICEKEGEGDSGLYGGNDDTDNSGTLKYVVVKYAGNVITSEDELNGIAFQGVGSGTTVDFVQVHNNADDGIEFFGGTVNAKHLIVTGADDDSVDWTEGYRGKLQHVLVLQNPSQPASDRGIEADSYGSAPDNSPRANPTLSNFTLVGGQAFDPDASSNTGATFRAGTNVTFVNSVITGFPKGLDIDDPETYEAISGIDVKSVLIGGNTANFATDTGAGEVDDLATFFAAEDSNNAVGPTSLDFYTNGSAEDAVTAYDIAAVDSWFDDVSHVGAVADNDWTEGWSFGLSEAPAVSCPAWAPANTDGLCVVEAGTVTGNVQMEAGLDFLLNGAVFIGEDVGGDAANPDATAATATLNIDAGVTIYATDAVDTVLVVSRGSQIFVNGTASDPVIMTTINDSTADINTATETWGGLAINGRATLNTCNGVGAFCEKEGEGDSGLYGGNDDADSSGHIYYLQVLYAGNVITSEDELNGIAFQGVGSGTVVDYVQVHNNADDGVEFFGGTVNVKHLVVTGSDDDSVDWTEGYRGKLQHVLIIQNENQSATDRGIEADSYGSAPDNSPRANPTLSNFTLVGGQAFDPDASSNTGATFRAGTNVTFVNSVITGFPKGLDIDDPETYAAIDGINFRSILLAGNTAAFATDTGSGEVDDLATFFAAEDSNNTTADASTLVAAYTGGRAYLPGATESAVVAYDINADDNWFDDVDYIGAFDGTTPAWTDGWTVWIDALD